MLQTGAALIVAAEHIPVLKPRRGPGSRRKLPLGLGGEADAGQLARVGQMGVQQLDKAAGAGDVVPGNAVNRVVGADAVNPAKAGFRMGSGSV